MLNDKTAKLLEKKEVYPEGANWPTDVCIYECACGKGTIEYGRVSGFDDSYVKIQCPDCAKRYRTQMGCGSLWELL